MTRMNDQDDASIVLVVVDNNDDDEVSPTGNNTWWPLRLFHGFLWLIVMILKGAGFFLLFMTGCVIYIATMGHDLMLYYFYYVKEDRTVMQDYQTVGIPVDGYVSKVSLQRVELNAPLYVHTVQYRPPISENGEHEAYRLYWARFVALEVNQQVDLWMLPGLPDSARPQSQVKFKVFFIRP
jgi:hypothetical protein